MFALIFWWSTAAFTVLRAVTGGEWWGFGVCALLGARLALLCALLCACCHPDILLQQRLKYQPPSAAVRIGDFLLDFTWLAVFGWLTQRGAHYGMLAVLLFLAGVLLHELVITTLEPKR